MSVNNVLRVNMVVGPTSSLCTWTIDGAALRNVVQKESPRVLSAWQRRPCFVELHLAWSIQWCGAREEVTKAQCQNAAATGRRLNRTRTQGDVF